MTILYEKCELCLIQPKLNKSADLALFRPRAFKSRGKVRELKNKHFSK
jgi:hypothetical protein